MSRDLVVRTQRVEGFINISFHIDKIAVPLANVGDLYYMLESFHRQHFSDGRLPAKGRVASGSWEGAKVESYTVAVHMGGVCDYGFKLNVPYANGTIVMTAQALPELLKQLKNFL